MVRTIGDSLEDLPIENHTVGKKTDLNRMGKFYTMKNGSVHYRPVEWKPDEVKNPRLYMIDRRRSLPQVVRSKPRESLLRKNPANGVYAIKRRLSDGDVEKFKKQPQRITSPKIYSVSRVAGKFNSLSLTCSKNDQIFTIFKNRKIIISYTYQK
jgi:hypothetical protein